MFLHFIYFQSASTRLLLFHNIFGPGMMKLLPSPAYQVTLPCFFALHQIMEAVLMQIFLSVHILSWPQKHSLWQYKKCQRIFP